MSDPLAPGRTQRPGGRLRAAAALLAAAFLAGCNDAGTSSAAGGPPAGAPGAGAPPPEVGVITLHPETVPFTATAPGRTVAYAVAEIRPQVNGIIQKRVFKEGSEVKAGDLLYQIDDRSYRAAVDSAEATVEKAQAAVTNAQAQFDRYQELGRRKVVSQQQIDEARATLLQAQADLTASNAALQTAQISLDDTKVTAPISGLIGTSSATEGALVTANQTAALATVRQIDPMFVDLTVASADLLHVRRMIEEGALRRTAQAPEVHLALEDGTAYPQTGAIEATEANVAETTGSVTIRASIPNPDHLLLPGMYVRATVEVGSDEKGFLLPQRAVSRNPKGQATALFVSADGKAQTRILSTERSYGDAWVVYENVGDGDRLIVDGLQKVREGQPVTPVAVELDAQGLAKRTASSEAPAPAK